MPDAVRIDLTGTEAIQALVRCPERLAVELRRGLSRYMASFVAPNGAWQRARMRGRPGLKRRSGELARSFDAQDVSGQGLGQVAAKAFTTSRYARVHEFGAIIRPVRARWLRFQVGRGRAAEWVTTKQVRIPARMGWFDAFRRDEGGRSIMVREAALRALGRGGEGTGPVRSQSPQLGPALPGMAAPEA